MKVAPTTRAPLIALVLILGTATSRARSVRAGDPAPVEALATVETEWNALKKPTAEDYRRFLARFHAAAGGDARARALATALIARFDSDDKAAHDALGHKEFAFDVPEEISYRRYPFVRIVEEARATRWFDDLDPYASALEAYVKCMTHAKRLAEDSAYAALDVARRGIDRDEHFHAYNYDAIFASPYLICYTTKERIDEAAMWKMPRAERARTWAELDARRVGYKRVLAEKARVYAQVYVEFLTRYGERCDLKSLMDEFGGRPDYPPGKRSYREGCPLVVWVFSDRDAWDDFHENVKKDPVDRSMLGYYSPPTGLVHTYDHAADDRETELLVNVRVAVLQLLDWFARQRNEWGPPKRPSTWFSAGFPDWFGSVAMAKDRTLTFLGLEAQRDRFTLLRGWKEQLEAKNRPLPVFPLRELVTFEGISSVEAWGAKAWSENPRFVADLFRQQSHALVLFLNEAQDGKHRSAFDRFVADMLNVPREPDGYATERFRKEFALETEDDWTKLDAEFQAFYADLAKPRPLPATYAPPALDDWPGYVAPDLEAPTGPPVGK